jgi:hypothetical protein
MEPTGIILDQPYANALIWRAWREGFAKHYPGDNPWKTKYSRQLLLKGVGEATIEDALFFLLCYGSAWLPPFDNFSIDALVAEDLARVLPSRYWERYGEKRDVLLYKGIVLRQLRKEGLKLNEDQLGLLAKWWGATDRFFSITGDLSDEPIPKEFWRDLAELNVRVPDVKLPRTWREARDGIFDNGDAGRVLNAILNFFELVDRVSTVTTHIRTLERGALGLGAPVKTNLESVRIRAITRESLKAEPSDAIRVWRIILCELDIRLTLNSLSDVLRLRDKRDIRNLRQVLQEWSVALRQKGPTEEKRLRNELRSAVRDLRRLGRVKRVGR